MKKCFLLSPRSRLAKAATLILIVCLILFSITFFQKDGGRVALNASAASPTAVMEIKNYQIDVKIREDRQIEFYEKIQMKALKSGSVFTRYLPMEGDRYYDIVAVCPENEKEFSYNIFSSEEDEYLCIDCHIPVQKNQTCTYEISYLMEIGTDDVPDGMRLDLIGFGWEVPLENVKINVEFPAAITEQNFTLYSGGYGTKGNDANVAYLLSADGKTLTLTADILNVVYNAFYYESMAQGITLEVQFPQGTLQSFASTRTFTNTMLWIVAIGILAVAAACFVRFAFRKKPALIPIVNIKAPDEMDPLKMGKLLDGMVDQEDVTSMIYYFAHQGYLSIDLEDEDNPVLIKKVNALPQDVSPYQITLFNGLFASGDRVQTSQLQGKFFSSVEIAKKQVLGIPMYKTKSIFGFILGGIAGVLIGWLIPLVVSISRIGKGYSYFFGIAFLFPILLTVFLSYLGECYQFKWKKRTRLLLRGVCILIAVVFTAIFSFAMASLIMTKAEKLVLSVFVFMVTFLTQSALTRTEAYTKTLGDILGFKDFIVVTEEDKIKFMLQENPQLYYKILPYAQVLGVTNEWEEKFASITIAPPTWCENTHLTVFDYMLINRCIHRSMVVAMMPPKSQGNGSFVGRSGGGGGFGGFGGGGHGGGGGGFR